MEDTDGDIVIMGDAYTRVGRNTKEYGNAIGPYGGNKTNRHEKLLLKFWQDFQMTNN